MVQNYGSTVQELPNIKLPAIMSATRGSTISPSETVEMSRTGRIGPTKPIKAGLDERKTSMLLGNPQSEMGQKILRERFNLPAPIVPKSRPCGQKAQSAGKLFSSKSNARAYPIRSHQAEPHPVQRSAPRPFRRPAAHNRP